MYHSVVALSIVFINILVLLFTSSLIYYIGVERGKIKGDLAKVDFIQFGCIIAFSLCCFIVLYANGEYEGVFIHYIFYLLGIFLVKVLFYKLYKNGCPVMLNSILFLLTVSEFFLYRLYTPLAIGQSKYIMIGFSSLIILPIVFKFLPKLDKMTYFYYLLGVFLLLLPNIFNSEFFLGSKNWVSIMGIKFQPSEFVKFIFVFYLASTFSKKLRCRRLFLVAFCSGIYIIILAFQNDFGAVLIFFMTFLTLVYIRTGSLMLFLSGIGGASFFAVLAYNFASHIQTRVAIWLNPWDTPYTSGYQLLQSMFAIGSYSPFGSGFTYGYPTITPIIESDFIYSGIAEEFGGVFALCIIFIYVTIFYRGVNIALRSKSFFHSLLVIGFTSILAFQTFVILGGVTKLIPLTGVTLPFISHGGTSVISSLFMFGILQLIFVYNKDMQMKGSINE